MNRHLRNRRDRPIGKHSASRTKIEGDEQLARELGVPREIRADSGLEFVSPAFRESLNSLGIDHRVLPVGTVDQLGRERLALRRD